MQFILNINCVISWLSNKFLRWKVFRGSINVPSRSVAAGGFVTFVATKVTKKAFSRKASLPTRPLPCKSGKNHGLQNVAPLRSLWAFASATIAMPLPRSWPPLFCLIAPEAVLLTLKQYFRLKPNARWAGRAGRVYDGNDGLAFAMCEARRKRKEPAGRAEAFFCLDFLVTFGSSQK